jgi:hypothetical protein
LIIFIYIFILISWLFRVTIILVVYFDLEIKSFDIINVFINTKHDLLAARVIYQLPDSYKKVRYIAKISRVLYKIYDSLIL